MNIAVITKLPNKNKHQLCMPNKELT